MTPAWRCPLSRGHPLHSRRRQIWTIRVGENHLEMLRPSRGFLAIYTKVQRTDSLALRNTLPFVRPLNGMWEGTGSRTKQLRVNACPQARAAAAGTNHGADI